MIKLNTGFASLSDTDFLMRGRGIVSALGKPPASSDFPSAAGPAAQLHTLLNTFADCILRGNAPGAKADREAARSAAADAIKRLAALLLNLSGDPAKMAHTGFPLRKEYTRDRTPTGTPGNVTAKPTGIPGEAKLSATRVHQALMYQARATQDPASGVFTECDPASSTRKLRFHGLERGKDWFFQIRALGPNGTGPWSDPAMMMVV